MLIARRGAAPAPSTRPSPASAVSRRRTGRFHVLSVLSRASLEMPEEMLAFYVSEGIDHVCFNVEESEGDYVSDLFQGAELRQRYETFLRTFWHLARADGRVKFVREIDHALPRVFRPEGVRARNIQVEPLGMINVDSHGNVSSFSPELLGYKNADYGDFLLGNINTQSLAEIYATTPGLGAAARHQDGHRGLPRALRVFLRLWRRRAGQQAVRERPLRQHDDVVLHADADGADRPDPGSLRQARAELDRQRSSRHRPTRRPTGAVTEDAMNRSLLFAIACLSAVSWTWAPRRSSSRRRGGRQAAVRLQPGRAAARGWPACRRDAVAGDDGDQRRGPALDALRRPRHHPRPRPRHLLGLGRAAPGADHAGRAGRRHPRPDLPGSRAVEPGAARPLHVRSRPCCRSTRDIPTRASGYARAPTPSW